MAAVQTCSEEQGSIVGVKRESKSVCLSVMSYSVTPWTVAHKAILLMEFSRREYWSGLPFPPPGGLPDPGIKPASLEPPELAGGFFTTKLSGKPLTLYTQCYANIRNMNQIHQLFPLALSTLFLPDF